MNRKVSFTDKNWDPRRHIEQFRTKTRINNKQIACYNGFEELYQWNLRRNDIMSQ